MAAVQIDGMTVFALELIREVLHALGPELQQYPELMHLIQVDLMAAIFSVFKECVSQGQNRIHAVGPINVITKNGHRSKCGRNVCIMYLIIRTDM